jgi:hypothetical protein
MANEPLAPLDEPLKARADAACRDLISLVDPKKRALRTSEGLPARMCHYTDFTGLKGILETNSIWATYGKTLNDSSEHKYGQGISIEYARKKVPPEAHRFIEMAVNAAPRNFVSCFCQSSQVLGMWRAYSAFGGGYCLEFDGSSLLGCAFPPHDPMALQMVYGDEMPQALQEVLDTVHEFAGRGEFEAFAYGAVLSMIALKFKHPAFAEEREWRLVVSDPDASHLRFRAGHANIRPYIELCPSMPDGSNRLPLQKVVYGPTLRDDEVLVETIRMMLEQQGYENVAVESSGIPYRL